MKKIPAYEESLSLNLGRPLRGNEQQTVAALRWLAVVSLFVFLALLIDKLLQRNDRQALVISIGIVPILVSLLFIRQEKVVLPSIVLSVNLVLLVTWLTSNGNGIYDIGILAFPVILLIAGLILRERFIAYLTVLIILCLGWLIFGDTLNIYRPVYPVSTLPEDFFLASIITLVASNSIYLLVRNVHQSLERAEQEIEARKKVEQERERLIQELESKNRELNRFAITVSHDLKTPLITVSGFLGYLEKDVQTGNYERLRKDINQINAATKKMATLVDQILDISRVGRIINPPTNVPFDEIVQESLKLAEGSLQERHVEVRVEPDLPVVHVDRARMVQVLQNLITNSVKFMGERSSPCVEIGVRKIDGESVFFVKDNGIGIDAAHQHAIFELFSKLDSQVDGNGIGLATVKRIVEVHGGKIWVESELGKGATFFFTLGQQVG
jgi:signal transduction histidine kinase